MESNWVRQVVCIYCKQRTHGTQSESQNWLNSECPMRKNQSPATHYGSIGAKYVEDEGAFKCIGCRRIYVRIVGGSATIELCENCADNSVIPKDLKLNTPRFLNCDSKISYYSRDLYGNNFSHVRKDFLFKGEDWSCAGYSSSYDTLSGSQNYACGKRASIHIKFESNYGFTNGEGQSKCAVVCQKCASRLMAIPGCESIGFI